MEIESNACDPICGSDETLRSTKSDQSLKKHKFKLNSCVIVNNLYDDVRFLLSGTLDGVNGGISWEKNSFHFSSQRLIDGEINGVIANIYLHVT